MGDVQSSQSGWIKTAYDGIKLPSSLGKLTELLVLCWVVKRDPLHASLLLSLDDTVGDQGSYGLHRAINKSV